MENETIPYTYLIGWSKENKYYYGVRYAKNCCPSDFWQKYFTSSKEVKRLRKILGEPDIQQIRKIFSNKNDAQRWEKKVLTRLKVLSSTVWLNENIGGIINVEVIKKKLTGRKLSEETKQKMREAKLGKPKTESHRKNMSKSPWNKGKHGVQKHTQETKQKIRNFNTGKKKSDDTKQKISNSIKNRVAT